MANRPAWRFDSEKKKIERNSYEFVFNAGFSIVQKQKNIRALHEQIGRKALEISTKSLEELGIKFSAFNLKLDHIFLENIEPDEVCLCNGLALLQKTPDLGLLG